MYLLPWQPAHNCLPFCKYPLPLQSIHLWLQSTFIIFLAPIYKSSSVTSTSWIFILFCFLLLEPIIFSNGLPPDINTPGIPLISGIPIPSPIPVMLPNILSNTLNGSPIPPPPSNASYPPKSYVLRLLELLNISYASLISLNFCSSPPLSGWCLTAILRYAFLSVLSSALLSTPNVEYKSFIVIKIILYIFK